MAIRRLNATFATAGQINFTRAPAGWANKYHGGGLPSQDINLMTIASDLLQQHIRTLVDDNARWQAP